MKTSTLKGKKEQNEAISGVLQKNSRQVTVIVYEISKGGKMRRKSCPRGWTDIPDWEDDKDENRLHCLRREGAPEEMSYFFNKYNICGNSE